MDRLLKMTATDQAALIASGDLSAETLMRATLARIEAVNGQVNAIVALRDADTLLNEARAMDDGPHRGPLHGLPIAIKELADVAGMVTSEGTPALAGRVATTDALHVARMRAAGAIFIGKTNVPEFGLGSHTVNRVYGQTQNAYVRGLSCGGSSGGAAVALALRMVSLADGSDMMGSLRNPAGWSNVYGFRPTWGRVPRDPLGDMYLHQVSTHGPMARCPGDLALLLNVMAGPDASVPQALPPQRFEARDQDVAGKRIGWLGDWGGAWPMEDGILPLCRSALTVLEEAGCVVDEIAPPFSRDALWQSWTTLRSWSVSNGLKPLLDNPETRRQLPDTALWEVERGRTLTAEEIQAASDIRSEWFRAAAALFGRYDAVAAPTAQVWPFDIDRAWPREIAGQSMDTYHRWMEGMVPASLIGLPALAMPAGFGAQGLPMGVQLIGRHGNDQGLLTLAQTYHTATRWPETHPPER